MLSLKSYEKVSGFFVLNTDELFFVNGGSGGPFGPCGPITPWGGPWGPWC